MGAFGMLGARWHLAGPESRLNCFLDVNYHAQAIGSFFDSKNDDKTAITTGSTDLFHGPTGSFGATF